MVIFLGVEGGWLLPAGVFESPALRAWACFESPLPPLKGGRLPDACFRDALRRVASRVPLLRGAGGIRRPTLHNYNLLLAQPIPNQLTLFLDIFGHIVSIFANIAIQHTHYC